MSNKSGSNEGKYSNILQQAQKEKAKIIQRYQGGLINTATFINQVNTFNNKYNKSKEHNEINALLFKPNEYQRLITEKLRSDLANAKIEHQILKADLMDDTQAMEAVIREHLDVTKRYLDAGFASKVLLHPYDFGDLGLDEKTTMKKINGPKKPEYGFTEDSEDNEETEEMVLPEDITDFSDDTESSAQTDSPRNPEPVSRAATTVKEKENRPQNLASETSQSLKESQAAPKNPISAPTHKAPTAPQSLKASQTTSQKSSNDKPAQTPAPAAPRSQKAASLASENNPIEASQIQAPPSSRTNRIVNLASHRKPIEPPQQTGSDVSQSLGTTPSVNADSLRSKAPPSRTEPAKKVELSEANKGLLTALTDLKNNKKVLGPFVLSQIEQAISGLEKGTLTGPKAIEMITQIATVNERKIPALGYVSRSIPKADAAVVKAFLDSPGIKDAVKDRANWNAFIDASNRLTPLKAEILNSIAQNEPTANMKKK